MLAATGLASARDDLRQPPQAEWTVYGGDYNNSRYSELAQVDTSNVTKLGGAWTMRFDAESSTATPIVKDGVMYMTAGVHVYALDARTGEKRWTYRSDVALSPRSVVLGEGRVFVGTRAARVLALEQRTGKLAWSTMIGDEPAFPGQMISGAPTYIDGLVIAGVANGDFGLRGRLVALNSQTGKQAWRFDTIPAPGEFGHDTWPQDSDVWKKGGAGVWMAPAVDPDLGMVYVGVGNAVPQWGGEERPGTIYTPAPCLHSTSRPASVAGTTSSCVTTSGITISARRSCCTTPPWQVSRARRSPRCAPMATCSCSIARPVSRSFRWRSAPFHRTRG